MATLLYRIGHFAYRKAWAVIGVWIAILIAVLGVGIGLGGQTQESFAIPGTESQQAIDKLDAVFPAAAGSSAQVVYQAPDGGTVRTVKYQSAIDAMAKELGEIPGVASALSPFSQYASGAISPDGNIAYSSVQFAGQTSEVSDSTIAKVKETADGARAAGLTVEFGGQVFQDNSFGITPTEALGVIFAAVVLLITFGSLLSAGMPLLTALLGVGITMGAVIAVSAFITVSSASPMLALMLGLAVGIDYSLFILSRHRTQLARGVEPEESAATSVATAGSAVVFAGATVIIALLGLLVVGIPFLSVMGLAAAFAVFISILVALTLVPAMFGLAGRRLIPKEGSRSWKRAHAHLGGRPTMGLRWVAMVMKAPVAWVIGVILVLGAVAVPALSLNLNLPSGASQPEGSTQRAAYDLIETGFGPGYNGPLVVAVDITQTTNVMGDLKSIAADLATLSDVASVKPGIPNPSLDTAIIQVIPKSAPDSEATKALVQTIRDQERAIQERYDTPIAVTGQTAVAVDISNRLAGALIPFALVVVGLSVLLLMMVFRSVFVPIKAAVGFLLSISASIGVVVAIFQWGWLGDLLNIDTAGPILSFLPIIMMALLFGLAMDYEVFLVSGMREEYVKSGDPRQAITAGFSQAARVVTAAALIMFFVFFAFVPEGSGVIKGIALGLAVGIFFDAFLVRMTLVPAAMALAGRAAWWLPGWLARLLPNVDIEGDGLRRHLADRDWASGTSGAVVAEDLVAGVAGRTLGPVNTSVPAGSVLILRGDLAERRVIAATLAGRLDPVSGRLQVLGHPLPSERAKVMRRVTLADAGTLQAHEGTRTVGSVLHDRLVLALPWWKTRSARRRVADWIERVNRALADSHDSATDRAGHDGTAITADTSLASLAAVPRAACLIAAALGERSGLVFIDLSDGMPSAAQNQRILAIAGALAPTTTTLVVGSSCYFEPLQAVAGRDCMTLDLDVLIRKGALR
ncbi:MAG: MMPL family transporter [Microbacteriaceae bacterium]